MNEMKMLLDSAVPTDNEPVDPAADLSRGRRRQRKQQMTRAWAGAAGLAVVAATTGIVVTTGPTEPVPPRAASAPAGTFSATTGSTPRGQLPAIELVAYTGKQVPGYAVKSVPEGWEIQGGNNIPQKKRRCNRISPAPSTSRLRHWIDSNNSHPRTVIMRVR